MTEKDVVNFHLRMRRFTTYFDSFRNDHFLHKTAFRRNFSAAPNLPFKKHEISQVTIWRDFVWDQLNIFTVNSSDTKICETIGFYHSFSFPKEFSKNLFSLQNGSMIMAFTNLFATLYIYI